MNFTLLFFQPFGKKSVSHPCNAVGSELFLKEQEVGGVALCTLGVRSCMLKAGFLKSKGLRGERTEREMETLHKGPGISSTGTADNLGVLCCSCVLLARAKRFYS